METELTPFEWQLLMSRSDPTYEAWKHITNGFIKSSFIGSDPTYEAWKLM